MIIWKGWGILGAIIPVIFIVLHNGFLGPDTIGWALLTSAVPVWLLGRSFHARPAEVMMDTKTNQQVLVKPQHDLFWVELDYWAIIFGMLGISFLLPESTGAISARISFLLMALVFVGRLGYRLYQKYLPEGINKKEPPFTKGKIGEDIKAPILNEAERKKKAFYAQMRNDRETNKNFKPSNHSNYFPGSIQPISEIKEKILFEEEE